MPSTSLISNRQQVGRLALATLLALLVTSVSPVIAQVTITRTYTVRLHFAELYWTSAGQRVFNVSINGSPVLTNYDIIADAGAPNKATIKEFPATADTNGQIVIQYTSVIDNAKSSAIEIVGDGTVAVNSGGPTVGDFAADTGFVGGTPYATNSVIDTSAVTNPAPQAVYQTERFGDFTYTFSGFTNTCAPVITNVWVSKTLLWPPNHKMVRVTVYYRDSDNCDPSPNCTLSVTSNEAVNGLGDGNTSPDWQILDAHHVLLRAERSGQGGGRIYTITITCTDASGNSASQDVTVLVPHDRGQGAGSQSNRGNNGNENGKGNGNGRGKHGAGRGQ